MDDIKFYATVGINDIPWNRLVQWYGRATNFPELYEIILLNDAEQQRKTIVIIGGWIEHQDGIVMATPFVSQNKL